MAGTGTTATSPATSLLTPEIAKLSLEYSSNYEMSLRIHYSKHRGSSGNQQSFHSQKNKTNTNKHKLTMQSIKYEEDEFQLIPYYPFKNNYEKYIVSHLPMYVILIYTTKWFQVIIITNIINTDYIGFQDINGTNILFMI